MASLPHAADYGRGPQGFMVTVAYGTCRSPTSRLRRIGWLTRCQARVLPRRRPSRLNGCAISVDSVAKIFARVSERYSAFPTTAALVCSRCVVYPSSRRSLIDILLHLKTQPRPLVRQMYHGRYPHDWSQMIAVASIRSRPKSKSAQEFRVFKDQVGTCLTRQQATVSPLIFSTSFVHIGSAKRPHLIDITNDDIFCSFQIRRVTETLPANAIGKVFGRLTVSSESPQEDRRFLP